MIAHELPLKAKIGVSKRVPKGDAKVLLTSGKDKRSVTTHHARVKGSFAALLQKEHNSVLSEKNQGASLAGTLSVPGLLLATNPLPPLGKTHLISHSTHAKSNVTTKTLGLDAVKPSQIQTAIAAVSIGKKLPVRDLSASSKQSIPMAPTIRSNSGQNFESLSKLVEPTNQSVSVSKLMTSSNLSSLANHGSLTMPIERSAKQQNMTRKTSSPAPTLQSESLKPSSIQTAQNLLIATVSTNSHVKSGLLQAIAKRSVRQSDIMANPALPSLVMQKSTLKLTILKTAKGMTHKGKNKAAIASVPLEMVTTTNQGVEKSLLASLAKHTRSVVATKASLGRDTTNKQQTDTSSNASSPLVLEVNTSSVTTPSATFVSMVSPTTGLNGYSLSNAAYWLQGDGQQLLNLAMAKARETGMPVQSSVEMTLIPAHLGKLKLNIHAHSSGELNVQFVTSADSSKMLLEKFLPDLKEQLLQSGFSSVSVDVRSDTGSRQQSFKQPTSPILVSTEHAASTRSVSSKGTIYLDQGVGSNGFFAEA